MSFSKKERKVLHFIAECGELAQRIIIGNATSLLNVARSGSLFDSLTRSSTSSGDSRWRSTVMVFVIEPNSLYRITYLLIESKVKYNPPSHNVHHTILIGNFNDQLLKGIRQAQSGTSG